MGALHWTWEDYWGWFDQLTLEEEKTVAIRELLKDKWLENLSVESQVKVMTPAPLYILQQMKNSPKTFKRETILTIEMNLNKKIRKMSY